MIFTADMLWVFPQKCPGREIWQPDPLQGVLILFPFGWKQPVTSNRTHLCVFKSEEHKNQDTEKNMGLTFATTSFNFWHKVNFFFTLNVQKCVSWRYQHTLRKTCLQLAAIKLGGKKLFFVYQNNIWHTLTFEEPCWQMFAVCSNKSFFKVLAMLFTDWKLLYGTNKIRIFTTEWFWFCSLVLYLSFSIFSIYKNLLTDWNLWSD